MKFLSKQKDSVVLQSNLSYNQKKDRLELRKHLLNEQKGFCAYSERYIQETDSHAVEHFNPILKDTNEDNYHNWYVSLTWMNEHKAKKLDERFLPILLPYDENLEHRITYKNGIYQEINRNDIEAKNLIAFLGWNKPEVKADRDAHIARVKKLKELCGDEEVFMEMLFSDKLYLSFLTALEYELELNLSNLISI